MATTAPTDPRITRTRRLLQEALLDLTRRHPLDVISVADIADRAQVNRSTFYQHYPDKETLLADALDAQATDAGADLSSLSTHLEPGSTPPDLIVRYVQHIAEHAQLYRRALGPHGSPIAVARLRHRITSIVLRGYDDYHVNETCLGMPTAIAAGGVAGSLLGMLIAWLDQEALAPTDDIARWIWTALLTTRET